VRIRPVHTYRSGFSGVAIGREYLDYHGFTGIQWFIHIGRKVWVFRGPNHSTEPNP
jgi:hypothetical protein